MYIVRMLKFNFFKLPTNDDDDDDPISTSSRPESSKQTVNKGFPYDGEDGTGWMAHFHL